MSQSLIQPGTEVKFRYFRDNESLVYNGTVELVNTSHGGILYQIRRPDGVRFCVSADDIVKVYPKKEQSPRHILPIGTRVMYEVPLASGKTKTLSGTIQKIYYSYENLSHVLCYDIQRSDGSGVSYMVNALCITRTLGEIHEEDYDKVIKRVIFNDPATIVYWNDGTKTIVKAQKGEKFDPYIGFCTAVAKRMLGNNSRIKKIVDNAQYDSMINSKKVKKANKDVEKATENIEKAIESVETVAKKFDNLIRTMFEPKHNGKGENANGQSSDSLSK